MKIFGVFLGVLALAVIAMFFVGGSHGPGRHFDSGDVPASPATQTPVDGSGAVGHVPPAGVHP